MGLSLHCVCTVSNMWYTYDKLGEYSFILSCLLRRLSEFYNGVISYTIPTLIWGQTTWYDGGIHKNSLGHNYSLLLVL